MEAGLRQQKRFSNAAPAERDYETRTTFFTTADSIAISFRKFEDTSRMAIYRPA